METTTEKKIIIVGAGFAGIRCALDLLKHQPKNTKIVLINNHDYFEYYPAMYRVATGSSPLQACIPLNTIFEGKDIEIIEETISSIDPKTKTVEGASGSKYSGDMLVLGVGSEATYFNIDGIEELSFNFRSIHQALRLRRRIKELFARHKNSPTDEALLSFHFVIVGGGASGVELAGELALYTRRLAKEYKVTESLITVDLVEAAPRVLPTFSEAVSKKVTKRLRTLGVNVMANRLLVRDESWTVFLRDMKLGAKTVIWTAGVKNNSLYGETPSLEFDKKGRVIVDEYLQIKGEKDVFVVGDNASTPYAGLAQTAIYDGRFVAKTILKKLHGHTPDTYKPHKISYDVPVGPGWAILVTQGITLCGRLAWLMRHMIDLRFYLSILPLKKAWKAFFSGQEEIRSGNENAA